MIEMNSRVWGKEHPNTLTSIANLSWIYHHQGRWKEAEELNVQVMEVRGRVLGEEHPDTLICMNNLAWTLKAQGRDDEALKLMTKCVPLFTEKQGANHPNVQASTKALTEWTQEKLPVPS